ncbi:MAG: LOG family protein [Acidobacteriota bacterium]
MENKRSPQQQAEWLSTLPSHRLAFEDIDFLHRDELRPVRLQLELLKPELLQQEQGVSSTIVVFGSARVPSPEEAEQYLARAEAAVEENPESEEAEAELERARRRCKHVHYYQEARRFARLVSAQCQAGDRCDCVITTGGGPGIMEAANRGAHEVGAKSIGLNIEIPHEQVPNPYITPELCVSFHYFALRKMHFLLRAKALVIFPGGFGTMDELFDALTLIQTKKMPTMPVVLLGRNYWSRVLALDVMVDEGTISPQDRDLMTFVDTAEEAWQVIRDAYPAMLT